jgi:hypothetical protein
MLPKENYRMYSPGHGGEFPTEKYLSEKTGYPVNSIYYGSGVVFETSVIPYLKSIGLKCIWEKRHYYEPDVYSLTEMYELELGEHTAIIGFSNRADDGYPGEDPNEEKVAQLKTAPLKGWVQTTSPIQDVFDKLPELQSYTKKDMKGKIHLLKSTSYGFETEAFDLSKPVIDLDLNYGTGFTNLHNNIVDTIRGKNDNKAKLVLLHGLPGTGKTTYLKYLAHELGKKVLFLPPIMAESIVNPDFVPFLMENKDCVLIIEDAEKVIGDRNNSGSSVGVSNLLNLSDGILGDILNIHVIATFNMDKEKIDSALLRKGRLIAEHKFGKLSLDDTKTLLKKLDKKTEATEGLTLAEIYNIDNQQDKSEEERVTIGFKRY